MIGILLGLQLLGGWPGLQLQPTMASLALASTPSESQFTLYDVQGRIVQQGKTPYVGMIPAGRYRLLVSKVGYFQEQRSLTLQPNQQQILQIELFPQPSSGQPPVVRGVTPGTAVSQPTPAVPTSRPVSKTPGITAIPAPQTVPSPTATPPQTGQPAVVQNKPTTALPQTTVPPTTSTPPVAGTPSKSAPAAGNVTKAKEKPKTAARRIPWLPLAAAAGLAVAGGIFWGLSGGALDASKDVNRTQIEAYNEYSQARSHRSTAVFLFAGGGVALGLAALFYFWPPSSDNKGKKQPVQGHDVPILGFSLNMQ